MNEKIMKSLLIAIISIISLTLILAVTKPTKVSFEKHIKKVMTTDEKQEALTRIIGTVFKIQASLTTTYEDHFVYAMGEFDVYDSRITYIGILGLWIAVGSDKSQ